MPVRKLYFTGGGYPQQIFFFSSDTESLRWDIGVLSIKGNIANLNEQHPHRGAYTIRRNREVYGPWVTMVRQFVNSWGHDKVPMDIRNALNNVEGVLGYEQTVW